MANEIWKRDGRHFAISCSSVAGCIFVFVEVLDFCDCLYSLWAVEINWFDQQTLIMALRRLTHILNLYFMPVNVERFRCRSSLSGRQASRMWLAHLYLAACSLHLLGADRYLTLITPCILLIIIDENLIVTIHRGKMPPPLLPGPLSPSPISDPLCHLPTSPMSLLSQHHFIETRYNCNRPLRTKYVFSSA
jgi:hypothetical protein